MRKQQKTKTKGASDFGPMPLACTLPQVLCQNQLLSNRRGVIAGTVDVEAASGRRDETHDIVFNGAEFLHAARVDGCRCCVNRVLGRRRTSRTNRGEVVSALGGATRARRSQNEVDDASVGRARAGGAAGVSGTESRQCGGVSDRRIGSLKCQFGGGNGT